VKQRKIKDPSWQVVEMRAGGQIALVANVENTGLKMMEQKLSSKGNKNVMPLMHLDP